MCTIEDARSAMPSGLALGRCQHPC